MSDIPFTQEDLQVLRDGLDLLSEKRRKHVLEVEKMAVRIGEIYLPGDDNRLILQAAALLHDITKEYSIDEHLRVLREDGIVPATVELEAPKTLHAMSAASLVPKKYPKFAIPEVISAIRWHTTGRPDMEMHEKIVYLADYIDESRKYPDCVMLRRMFWDPDPASMGETEKKDHLRRVLIESFDITVRGLIEDGLPFHPATVDARNSLIINLI